MKQQVKALSMILLFVGCMGIAYFGAKIVTDGITALRVFSLGAYLFTAIVNMAVLIHD